MYSKISMTDRVAPNTADDTNSQQEQGHQMISAAREDIGHIRSSIKHATQNLGYLEEMDEHVESCEAIQDEVSKAVDQQWQSLCKIVSSKNTTDEYKYPNGPVVDRRTIIEGIPIPESALDGEPSAKTFVLACARLLQSLHCNRLEAYEVTTAILRQLPSCTWQSYIDGSGTPHYAFDSNPDPETLSTTMDEQFTAGPNLDHFSSNEDHYRSIASDALSHCRNH